MHKMTVISINTVGKLAEYQSVSTVLVVAAAFLVLESDIATGTPQLHGYISTYEQRFLFHANNEVEVQRALRHVVSMRETWRRVLANHDLQLVVCQMC